MTGPHKRRGRRRRFLKALVIGAVLLALLVMSTWMVWEHPAGRTELSASELGFLCNLATYSPGQADEIQEQYPVLTPGELEILSQLERDNPGFTAALMERYEEHAEAVNAP